MTMYFKDQNNKVHSIDADHLHLLPSGCVAITDEEAGAIITEANTLSPKDILLQEIIVLEAQITPRRRDEAIIGEDGGWLKAQRDLISNLRTQLFNV